jgi:hypothetical protein
MKFYMPIVTSWFVVFPLLFQFQAAGLKPLLKQLVMASDHVNGLRKLRVRSFEILLKQSATSLDFSPTIHLPEPWTVRKFVAPEYVFMVFDARRQVSSEDRRRSSTGAAG